MMKLRVSLWLFGVALIASPCLGQGLGPDLSQVSIEELLNIEITSASRKEQRASEVAAAVFVITRDDIRRSGMTTIPDVLRLVPGAQVAQINASNWAVSIRGFNGQFSNKLLVLVDGRSIYKRNFSGVSWDAEDVMLEDIEHIEVIRGPGGAVWGANAVNGVINIVTRAAGAAQGGVVRVRGGTIDRLQATARYGGALGLAAYRVYTHWADRGDSRLTSGATAQDGWNTMAAGGRLDWTRGPDEWTVDGGVRTGNEHPLWNFIGSPVPGIAPLTDKAASFRTGHALARWTRHGDNDSTLLVQSDLAIARRSMSVADNVTDNENTFDITTQYHARAGPRHDVVAGGGYRLIDSTTTGHFAFSLSPPASRTSVTNVFAQDEVAITNHLRLALGAKLERDSVSGWGVAPAASLMWEPASRHHAWFSVSRARRTPSNTDLAIRINAAAVPGPGAPILIALFGNPDYQAEHFQDVEAGYRFIVGSMLSVDVTAFRGQYTGLPTSEPIAPVFETTPGPPHLVVATRFENRQQASTAGLEIAARFAPSTVWRLTGSYSSFNLTPRPDSTSRDPGATRLDGNAPAHQGQVRSTLDIGPRTELDTALFFTGALGALAVRGHARADARVEVRLTEHVSAIAAGTNLLDPEHVEFAAGAVVATQVPRRASLELRWTF